LFAIGLKKIEQNKESRTASKI